jgi:hypothetical protein
MNKEENIKGFKWNGWIYPAQQTESDAHVIAFNFNGTGYREYDMKNGRRVKCKCKKYKSIEDFKKDNV